MNVGQILETHLGWASRGFGRRITAALEDWRAANPNPEAASPPEAVREALLQAYGEEYAGDINARSGDQIVERSEEHTSELQSLMRISYAVFCLKTKNTKTKSTEVIQQ